MFKLSKIATLMAAAATAAALATPAFAEELTGTMKKIKETGTITVSHREASIPFSYLDDNQKPIGYSVDICNKVVEAVKAELKMPNLAVKFQPVTSSNRIPLLQNGTIDLECGSTTNSVERQKQVAFGNTYFVINVTVAVKKSSGINTMADLNGKTVSTTSGTTSVAWFKKYKRTENADIKSIYGKDHAESFLLLADDRVAAFIMDDVLLAGQIANSRSPADYKILPESMNVEPYGPMLRKDDPQFKKIVDTTLASMMKSGEMEKIYAKWFTSPIPPKNVNMNFPMSPALKAAFANPNDKGAE